MFISWQNLSNLIILQASRLTLTEVAEVAEVNSEKEKEILNTRSAYVYCSDCYITQPHQIHIHATTGEQ